VENLFNYAEHCLFNAHIDSKLTFTFQARKLLDENRLSMQPLSPAKPIASTCFPEKPVLMLPRDMPRRRLNSDAGKAAFFHALAHIEFMAIYLAWDIIYRFRGLPEEFYRDWLRIADEEAQHFALIRRHLQQFQVDYGDLPAHRGLWLHAEETADNLLARLAVVPRCMEARGLDVTPLMIEKLKELNDQQGVAVLSRIYADEIGHVERGSYWFNYFAEQQGLDAEQTYKEMIVNCFKGKPKGPFNREVRIIAGFSTNEIDWLEEQLHE
jgi:uncharacterized ferritin-like protein (DUF455 family)